MKTVRRETYCQQCMMDVVTRGLKGPGRGEDQLIATLVN